MITNITAGAEKNYTPIESKFEPTGIPVHWDEPRLFGFSDVIDRLHPEKAFVITFGQADRQQRNNTVIEMKGLTDIFRDGLGE